MELFEICVDIEERYGVLVGDYLSALNTVGDVINFVYNSKGKIKTVNNSSYKIDTFPKKKRKVHHWAFSFLGVLSKLIWRINIDGLENINLAENYIICPNHESHLDGFWIWYSMGKFRPALDNIACMAKEEHLKNVVTRFFISMLGGIPVDRIGNPTPAMHRTQECIKDGYCVLIHPEGTRTRNGKLGEFKQGAAKLALDSGTKVIPVCIDGAYEIYPPDRNIPRLFNWKKLRKHEIKICYGTPIEPEGKTVESITQEIRNQIVGMKKEIVNANRN